MTDEHPTQDKDLSADSMQTLLLKQWILQTIIEEAEAKNDPRLDNPELREGRPGAREQLKIIQDEIERRNTHPIDQIVALKAIDFNSKAPGL